jgi:AcrR family transcriptional regulator
VPVVSRRERLRAEMTAEIIAIARQLLEKGGASAISVRAIARQLGVSATAIYRYFPSLDALVLALNESVTGELRAALEEGRDRPGGIARAFRGWALDHPASFRFLLGLDAHRDAGPPLAARLPSLTAPAPPPLAPPALAQSALGQSALGQSALGWATLCGLALLELACAPEDLPEDIGWLYEAAATTRPAGQPPTRFTGTGE